MGFFAPKCVCCQLAILSPSTLQAKGLKKAEWLTRAVAVLPSSAERGQVTRGVYNGYGSIVSRRSETNIWRLPGLTKWPAVYHEDCWKAAGEPIVYEKPSADDPDQGFFISVPLYATAKSPLPDKEEHSCPHCAADLTARGAVERHYYRKYAGDDAEDAVGYGHYLPCGTFEPDMSADLSGGVFDLSDDSDLCAACEGQL